MGRQENLPTHFLKEAAHMCIWNGCRDYCGTPVDLMAVCGCCGEGVPARYESCCEDSCGCGGCPTLERGGGRGGCDRGCGSCGCCGCGDCCGC